MDSLQTEHLSVATSFSRDVSNVPLNLSTEQHLERLAFQALKATATVDEAASVAFLSAMITPDFIVCIDDGIMQPGIGFWDFVPLMVTKKTRCGTWLTRVISITATVLDEQHAVVWLHYQSKGSGQTVAREQMYRSGWTFLAAETKWLCHRVETIRGPSLNCMAGSTTKGCDE
jgi:hypothetical protein